MNKVQLHADKGEWTLTLNDPDRRNCLDYAMCAELAAAVATVRADPDARTLVVTGAGKAFCAGADLPALFGEPGRDLDAIRRRLHTVYESFLTLRDLKIPTIAAVQGAAVGAGLNLALACDVRIAGPHAKFAATFTQIGLHPGGGCTWFLVDLLGREKAFALLLDGGTLDGPSAVAQGLALRMDDQPLGAAHELAKRWAALDPALARHVKTTISVAHRGTFEDSLELEAWSQAFSATGPSIQEAVARFRK